jgi:hypothetical protein
MLEERYQYCVPDYVIFNYIQYQEIVNNLLLVSII